ncbi:MAG: Mpo1 family 2-hydroxy fatty acid dioxygenase [Polaromonas sp.]|uniref:Mpo1 family 2-hydroxy fatty acid dioxygenase n=1 Tax=Polaromonas sp. TaxID=1869339 RepID=UPI0040361CDC
MTSSVSPDSTGMRRVDQLLAHYEESHRNPQNELIHFIAIPLIMLSLVGMMFALHPLVAYAFIAASMVYYLRLSRVFLVTMLLWSVLTVALVFAMGPWVLELSVAIFVGAWILQFIGHKLEGKKPSFFEDIQYLWVGPLFVLSRLFTKLGLRW